MDEKKQQKIDEKAKMAERLRLVRTYFFDDDNKRFAQVLGVEYSNASKLVAGVSMPRQSTIANLLKATPELSPDWLLNGNGNMTRSTISIGNNSGNVAGVNNGTQQVSHMDELVLSQQRTIEQLTNTNAQLAALLANK